MLVGEAKRRDLGSNNRTSANQRWVRALANIAEIAPNRTLTLPRLAEQWAERFGNSLALLSRDESLTFLELAERMRAYSRWAQAQSLHSGDVVALLMANCPDYFAIWMGLTRIGVIVGLINTNLTDAALFHALNIARPVAVIAGAEYAGALDVVRSRLPDQIKYWTPDAAPGFDTVQLDHSAESARWDDANGPTLADPALYIYTSGTTGLPKAAKVSHYRLAQWSLWFAGLIDSQPADRMYNCLPMYHSVGGVVAIGSTLVGGGSVLIRERFSASQFWRDLVEFDCTLFQYIGELCRYLVNCPPVREETAHRLRLCCGNGLRADVWERFQQRFKIPQILEFYAATEANISLYNCEGEPGAIGRIPAFLAHRYPIMLAKIDPGSGEPMRDKDGWVLRAEADEPGEALAKIAERNSGAGQPFEGYTDQSATAGKILRDVRVSGDAWFRTGDLMRRDSRGYFYFVDRLGDNIRWKGENVSTAEVAEVLGGAPGVLEAVVYGVAVPGEEGRAAMAALVVSTSFDLKQLHEHLIRYLPQYARPLFLRLTSHLEYTGTFKNQKQELMRAGFDPSASPDPIFFNDAQHGCFTLLDARGYQRLRASSTSQ